MASALRDLTDSASYWSFHLIRSSVDLSTGEKQSPGLILYKGDEVDLNDDLDERLIRSRVARLMVSWEDGGSVDINLTGRSYERVTPSPSVKVHMDQFEKAINDAPAVRWTSTGLIALLVLWPILAGMILAAIATILDPAMQAAFLDRKSTKLPMPGWADETMKNLIYFWPVTLVASIPLGAYRTTSGGLKVGKKTPLSESLLLFFFRVRSELQRIESWRQVIITVVTGVLVGLLTVWLTK